MTKPQSTDCLKQITKHLLTYYDVSGTVLGDTAGNKTDMIPAFLEHTHYWEDTQETNDAWE